MKQFKPVIIKVGIMAILAIIVSAYFVSRSSHRFVSSIPAPRFRPVFDRGEIAAAIGRQRIGSESFAVGFFPVKLRGTTYQAQLTLIPEMQRQVEEIYARYNPVYAAFVAIDPNTGRILAMVDHADNGHPENLILQASFPAASVFKVVTSAAAIEEGKVQPETLIPYTGATTTLYKRNLRNEITRWTRFTSVEEALAKSNNTVFGKLAMNQLGQQTLQKYADRFGFNQSLNFDMPVEISNVIVPDDPYGLAEAGSGYTKRQTISPIQGALLAASIINKGEMPNPYFIEKLIGPKGESLYQAEQGVIRHPISPETARALSRMMEHTIKSGTARKEYRDYDHHPILSRLFIGAKTGSLSGENPQGKYDWFVGFAQATDDPSKKIAFASMIVNREYWRVKSSHVAREVIVEYFRNKISY